jgi:hypothetical protein
MGSSYIVADGITVKLDWDDELVPNASALEELIMNYLGNESPTNGTYREVVKDALAEAMGTITLSSDQYRNMVDVLTKEFDRCRGVS